MMHEIITLQLGQKSNYLATHFWNTQESYFTYSADEESLVDHDIHFRPGIGADGTETFTPRTLIYDLKGGFGSLRKINALYEVDEPAISHGLWNGPAVVQRQAVIQQNEYQRSLEEGLPPPQLTSASVRYWSDFNRVYFHPRSVVQLNEYELNSSLTPFDNWSVGEGLFNSLDKEHDLLDRDLRYFAEEADQMQGIQLMAEVDDAWGGFAAKYLDRIKDEYAKTPVVFWGLEENTKNIPREKRFMKLSNSARSISEIAPQASIYVPLTLPTKTLPQYIVLDQHSHWEVSGLLSTAMESVSLPSRLKMQSSSRETFGTLANCLNVNGNQTIAKLRMSIDQKLETNRDHKDDADGAAGDSRMPLHKGGAELFDVSEQNEVSTLDMDFFPTETGEQSHRRPITKTPHVFGQTENFRADKHEEGQDNVQSYDGYERARRRAAGLPILQRAKIPMAFPLLDSFPNIFAPVSTSPNSVAVSTSLSTDTTVSSRVKDLQYIVGRAVGIDEREALSNSLGEIAEAYEEGWDSGTDEDDD
ncbi:tubulin domain-containing protein [Tricladium varicosporioides]|nr:tubulin domain-containing protein [Hymenoscyphus varicosporioides]